MFTGSRKTRKHFSHILSFDADESPRARNFTSSPIKTEKFRGRKVNKTNLRAVESLCIRRRRRRTGISSYFLPPTEIIGTRSHGERTRAGILWTARRWRTPRRREQTIIGFPMDGKTVTQWISRNMHARLHLHIRAYRKQEGISRFTRLKQWHTSTRNVFIEFWHSWQYYFFSNTVTIMENIKKCTKYVCVEHTS